MSTAHFKAARRIYNAVREDNTTMNVTRKRGEAAIAKLLAEIGLNQHLKGSVEECYNIVGLDYLTTLTRLFIPATLTPMVRSTFNYLVKP